MFRGVPSGSHCPAHSPPRGTHLRIRSATLVRFAAPQGGCRTGRELDGCLNRPLPRSVSAPVVLGLRVHRHRSTAPLAAAGADGAGDAARRPVGRRTYPAHRLQPLRTARRVLPEPRLLALLDRGAHRGRPAHRTDLGHRAATGPRAGRVAGPLRRSGPLPRAWLPRRCLPPAGRLAPLSAAPAGPGRGRTRVRRAPLGTGYGQQPLLGRPVGPDHAGPGPFLPPRRPRPRRRRGPAHGSGLRPLRAPRDGLPGRRIRRRGKRVRGRGPVLQRAADRLRARTGPYRPGVGRDRHGPARARSASPGC